jgi:ABC-2 type transport system permease protein
MSDLALAGWQVRYEQRAFWRNRTRAFFAFMFPIMFLLIFGAIFNNTKLSGSHPPISYDVFFVPGILAYGVITTTFVNLAISTAILRDEGVLKRMQAMPLPRWAYIAGRIGSTIVVVAAMCAVTLAVGVVVYGVHVRASTLPGLLVALALGTICFTALGIGIVRFIPNAEAAPPIVNIAILPVAFISGIFFSNAGIPHWLRQLAAIFPIHALADACQHAFNPYTTGAGFAGHDLLVIAIWAAIGLYLMVRFLSSPLGEEG